MEKESSIRNNANGQKWNWIHKHRIECKTNQEPTEKNRRVWPKNQPE